MPDYVHDIRNGEINPTPNVRVLAEAPSTAVLDADNSLGHISSIRAMQLAIAKAHATGIAAVTVRNSNHYGASACFAMMALSEGMIGFTTTKTRDADVAPYGGASGVLGNHPIAYAIPTQAEPPIVLDMACGIVASRRIEAFAIEGKQLPPGWALTTDGQPTRDACQAKTILPIGGPKGHGLAIVMSILGGVLTGGPAACNRTPDTPPELAGRGHLFYALKVSNFCPLAEFTEAVDLEIRTIRNSKRADGVDRIYLPGEIEWLNQQEALRHGIPLHRQHLDELAEVAVTLGTDVFWQTRALQTESTE